MDGGMNVTHLCYWHTLCNTNYSLCLYLLFWIQISNMGRPLKSFASATLNIQWPKQNKEGKWLLYLLQITGPNNQSIPCSPASEISPIRHPQEVSDTFLTTLYQCLYPCHLICHSSFPFMDLSDWCMTLLALCRWSPEKNEKRKVKRRRQLSALVDSCPYLEAKVIIYIW